MQAALPIMNSARPSFGKPEVTAQQSRDLAQTLNQITSAPTHVYHITTTEGSTEDQEFNLGDEAVTYTTQYYTTVEPQSSASSPRASPERDESGMLTPASISSKESGSSSDAGSEEEDSPTGGSMLEDVKPQNICLKSSPQGAGGNQHSDHHGHICNGNSGNTVAGTTVKNWTYEDQFKQLYNVSPEPERKEFLDRLFDFMQRKGSPITRIPIMAKQPLDLYRLFKLVVERGGLVEVIKKKAWRNVAKELNLPASITSAAFTMRSQYQKYLYPYECETVKLSDPQELQMAIDSNKRDRRHSDTIPLGLGDASNSVITTQAIKMIPSPTVPHAVSGSPYSGGYIVTPGGIMATGQIVQLPQVPGVPIVMSSHPSHHAARSESSRTVSEDGEDETRSPMEPPLKKLAIDANQVKVALSSDSGRLPQYVHTTAAGNLIMTGPGGTPIVAHPSMGPGGPQFIQMAAAAAHHPASHIPIVLPTQTAVSSPMPTPLETNVNGGTAAARSIRVAPHNGSGEMDANNIRMTTALQEAAAQRRTISMPVPVPIAAIPPQTTMAATTGSTLSPQQHSSGVLTMPPGSTHHIPAGLVPVMAAASSAPPSATPASPGKRKRAESPPVDAGNSGKKTVPTDSPTPANSTSMRMPFTNISIQPTGESNGDSNGSIDPSLLVTLQLNSVVYQGVLFAKPCNSVALSNSSTPSR